jgi:hypothetical protein
MRFQAGVPSDSVKLAIPSGLCTAAMIDASSAVTSAAEDWWNFSRLICWHGEPLRLLAHGPLEKGNYRGQIGA